MNTRKILAIVLILAMALSLSACAKKAVPSGVEDGVLTVAMECAYAPYNWAQTDSSNGAVPIKGSNLYANGYDVMTAQQICDANGWKLEVVQLEWDSLIPAILSGTVDCTIAGQSMTAERMETVDFAGPYLYATMVCLTRKDSAYANAKGLKDLSGGTCTSQSGTIWYDTCLPQIGGAKIQSPAADAPAMLMAVASGTVDFVCTDMPTAQGALIAYPDLKILDFAGSGDDFQVSEEEINIGIALKKGNKTLKDAIDKALKGKTADDFNALMADAIKVQPIGQ